jgi:hypothetical protein
METKFKVKSTKYKKIEKISTKIFYAVSAVIGMVCVGILVLTVQSEQEDDKIEFIIMVRATVDD